MFTGIIEETGTVQAVKNGAHSSKMSIKGKCIFDGLRIGDSVAVNGVCLTVAELDDNTFRADVMHETLKRSTLGGLRAGSRVNLERALAAGDRFGGHIVSGHIDGTGVIAKIFKDDNAVWYTIKADGKIMRLIVEKGSVAIDGVSLTVAEVETDRFAVSVIPHTAAVTIFSEKKVGDSVNLENDVIGKYVEKLMNPAENGRGGIDMAFLSKFGY